eukprot:4696001-Prymnesium_polylepis.1
MFVRRGAAPTTEPAWRAPAHNPLELTPTAAGSAPAGDTCPLGDPTAAACDDSWYLAVVGEMVQQVQVTHTALLRAGDSLEPLQPDGEALLAHAPHSGNFVVRTNRTSPFRGRAVWDFDYAAPPADCGGARGCGL